MPDLSALVDESASGLVLLGFGVFLTGHGVPFTEGSNAHAHYKLFVLQVDKALRRYASARDHLQHVVQRSPQSTGIDHVARATADLEDVFHALHQAIHLLRRLKEAREAPVRAKDLLAFDDALIERIRNVSAHVDEALLKGEIAPGDDVMIRVWGEGVAFVGESVSYETLGVWLKRLHAVARELIEHDPFADQRPPVLTVEPD